MGRLFCNPYSYKFKGAFKKKTKSQCISHVYVFFGKNNMKYVFAADCYGSSLYAVRFYAHTHKRHKQKYSLLTGKNDAFGVVSTCIAIMKDVYATDPKASFIFIGAEDTDEKKQELQRRKEKAAENPRPDTTRRFNVWSSVLARHFQRPHFHFMKIEPKNASLFLNLSIREEERASMGLLLQQNDFWVSINE